MRYRYVGSSQYVQYNMQTTCMIKMFARYHGNDRIRSRAPIQFNQAVSGSSTIGYDEEDDYLV